LLDDRLTRTTLPVRGASGSLASCAW
jgi:hypothetical protein